MTKQGKVYLIGAGPATGSFRLKGQALPGGC